MELTQNGQMQAGGLDMLGITLMLIMGGPYTMTFAEGTCSVDPNHVNVKHADPSTPQLVLSNSTGTQVLSSLTDPLASTLRHRQNERRVGKEQEGRTSWQPPKGSGQYRFSGPGPMGSHHRPPNCGSHGTYQGAYLDGDQPRYIRDLKWVTLAHIHLKLSEQ